MCNLPRLHGLTIRAGWRMLVAVLGILASGPAAAVECGEALTQDTVLEADLLDCPGDGLIVGADGIQIDLGGHLLRGSNAAGTAGIRNEGRHSVEIRNGHIEFFEAAVHLARATGNRIEGLSGRGGIVLVESDHNLIRGTSMFNGDRAILLIDSHRNRVEANDSNLHDNGFVLVRSDYNELVDNRFGSNEDYSLFLESSDHNLVRGNRSGSTFLASIGLSDSHDNRVIENTVMGGDDDTIVLWRSHRNVIARNELVGEEFGLSVTGSHHNRIESNIITGQGWTDVVRIAGDYNQVTGNTVIGVRRRVSKLCSDKPRSGIRVSAGRGNRLTRNAVAEHCLDGIVVEAASRDTRLLRNLAYDNGDDGIDLEDPTAKIVGNTALGNGDYGIEAVPGVRGGGNQASGNGNPDQCLNMTCN